MAKTPEEIAAEAAAAAAKVAADQAAAQAAAAKAAHLAEHGYPLETAVADMTPEQQASYWRAEAKKQQKKNEGVDIEKLQADAAELANLRTQNSTDAEKAVDDARREGENIGAAKYLKDAVMGRFMALTGKKDDEAENIFAHVDPTSFVDEKGSIDPVKLKAFADSVAKPAAGSSTEDPVAAALARQRAAGGGSGTSIGDRRKEVREHLTPTKA